MKYIKLFEQFISELAVTESLKAKTPNEVITIQLDMAWDDSNPEEEKTAKAAFKKYKIKVDSLLKYTGEPGTYEVTGKKKDILAYLKSDFYDMEDDAIEEYYPELLEGRLMWIGPFQFTEEMSDEKLKKMYDDAISGYAYWDKSYGYPKSDYKKAYQEIEKILKKRGIVKNVYGAFVSARKSVNEADVDPEIAKQLNHFYEMQNKIKEYEKEIEAMKEEFKQFADELKPMMDGMKEVGEKLAKTEDFIIAISRFGGERKDASYKNAFENALSKVNAATKKVLEEALEASKKVTNVKHSFNIQKVEEANIFTKIGNLLKSAVSKFLNIFKKEGKVIDDANKELAKLAK
jgi:hypothetical protein